VNIARGGLVNEADLYAALQSNIAGAGLDVYEKEPLASTSPLQTLPNVVLTGHNAGITDLFGRLGLQEFLANVNRFADGKLIQNRVNEPNEPRVQLN
jgi:phosphoglycerate dehydrogenase-like enzyme